MIRQRALRKDDIPAIMGFKKKSVRVSFPGHEFSPEKFRESLERHMEKEPEGIQVLEEDGKIIGYIWFSSGNGDVGEYGLLRQLFVDEEYRGKGLAERLIRYAEEYFFAKGIKRIKLTVTMSNSPAIRLYEKLKYDKTRVVMEKTVE
ncbi:MAG: GNAT family N-acetyltransferase [Candidatus Aenigmarchaeota archaeon]|nr:GNAT family N-acetyltransferase [Candidatus Aenigmarchaeota archaeon]